MIKIGIELSSTNLHYDLLKNPGRYFFIREADSQASLCIQTCDFQGENARVHIVDVLKLNEDGNLSSIFEDNINDAISERQERKSHSCYENKYRVSCQLEEMLSEMPDFMDWIISSILSNGRNLVIYPFEDGI